MAGLKVEITRRTGETNDILSFLDPKYEALEPQHAKFITELFDLVNHSTNDFEWDPKSERNNHASFIKLLNKITSGSAPNREKNASGPRLFFSACDRATEDSVGSEEKLKPDGVGHFASKSLTKDKSIPWRDSIKELFLAVTEDKQRYKWKPKSEEDNYPPFIKLLNGITSLTQKKNAPGSHLRFSVYNREMEDRVGPEEKLKPDGVGYLSSQYMKKEDRISWGNVRVAVEVKNKWRDMLLQAATYGRAMMTKRMCPLSFALLFNQSDFSVRVVCFTRPVTVTSQELFLKNELDFQMFVRAVWTIASFVKENADLERYATTIDGHGYFALPANDGSHTWWRTTEQLAERTTINGRATRVYVIECVAVPSQEKQDTGGQQIEYVPF
ncbi:hypothetical protein OF83DRAFT_1180450 [Amylostereum chailletii]|nr:hypothetical protein OF83DRAFT_1180450 [Amylostereum chailletii]